MAVVATPVGTRVHAGVMDHDEHPGPKVPERAKRRQFTADYKARILAEYESLPAGESGTRVIPS